MNAASQDPGPGPQRASRAWRPVRAVVDALGTAVFATVFVAINLQVFMRYAVQQPVSWSEEFPTLAFTIAVLWAAALMLKASDHILFELLTDLMPPRLRLAVGAVAALAVAGLFAAALPAILDFALYMKALRSPLRLRVRVLPLLHRRPGPAQPVRHLVRPARHRAHPAGRLRGKTAACRPR